MALPVTKAALSASVVPEPPVVAESEPEFAVLPSGPMVSRESVAVECSRGL
jgi:hypothetical protein